MTNNITPFITIIILTYKRFDKLEFNLKSIANQDFVDFEVLIKDDHSPNFSEEYVKSVIPTCIKDKCSIISNSYNMGTVKNYNEAIKIANGKIIVPLSQDDRFSKESSLRYIAMAFENPECNVCTGKRVGEKSGLVFPVDRDFELLKTMDYKSLYQRICFMNFVSGSVTYYRKSFLEKIGFFDERYVLLEDYPTILRIVLEHIRIYTIDDVIIIYGEDGVSNGRKDTNVQIVEDNLCNYNSNIKANLKIIESKKIKRYIKYYYIKLARKNNIFIKLKYLDIIILNRRITKKFIECKDADVQSYRYYMMIK